MMINNDIYDGDEVNYIILIHVIIASHKDDDGNCIEEDGEYDLPYPVPFFIL